MSSVKLDSGIISGLSTMLSWSSPSRNSRANFTQFTPMDWPFLLRPHCLLNPYQSISPAICHFSRTKITSSFPRNAKRPSPKRTKRYYSSRSVLKTVVSSSRRSSPSRRPSSSPCPSTHTDVSPRPSGPQKSQLATKHSQRRWPSFTRIRKNLSLNNRLKTPNLLQTHWLLALADSSLLVSTPGRLEPPPAAIPGSIGCECRRLPDCSPVHHFTLSPLSDYSPCSCTVFNAVSNPSPPYSELLSTAFLIGCTESYICTYVTSDLEYRVTIRATIRVGSLLNDLDAAELSP